MDTEARYRIPIDGRWDVRDLYVFPHVFAQVYSLMYVLEADLTAAKQMRREHVFAKFPWRGGYSAINFYDGVYFTIPPDERPQIIELKYASPGWIDLGLLVGVAIGIKQMLVAFSEAGRHLNTTYNQIQDGIRTRKLNDIKLHRQELKLEGERLKFVHTSANDLAKLMGFKHLKEVHEMTGNPFISLKILLSLYRRLRTISEYEEHGKTKITHVDKP